MWSLRVRAIKLCIAPVAVAMVGGCLSRASYEGSLTEYDRVSAATRRSSSGDQEVALSGKHLKLPQLVRAVLARNPNLEVAHQAWRGALASYREVTSHADTQLAYTVAPLSLVSSDTRFGQTIQVSQALEYPGKRSLRGEVVLALADAKREGVRAVRRRLASVASGLYYDYFVVGRALVINAEHSQIVTKYRDTVNIYLSTANAWLEDAAEVRVAFAMLAQERLSLESRRDVIVAQLNALLHRRPSAALPAAPTSLELPTNALPSLAALRDEAFGARPELRAVGHRLRGAHSQIALAQRDFYPDFRVSGTYNTMFASIEHQLMVGVSVNLPLQKASRRAAVTRTRAAMRMTRAEQSVLRDDIVLELKTARRRAAAADLIAAAYRDTILPAANARIAANRTGLPTRRTNFVDIIRSERRLKNLELRYAAAVADTYRYRVQLDRTVGRIAGLTGPGASR